MDSSLLFWQYIAMSAWSVEFTLFINFMMKSYFFPLRVSDLFASSSFSSDSAIISISFLVIFCKNINRPFVLRFPAAKAILISGSFSKYWHRP